MRPALFLLALASLASLLSCGGASDLPHSSEVTLTITPAAATIPVNGSIDLQGNVVGLSNPTLDWWQQDHHDATGINGSQDCDYVRQVTPYILSTCTAGYLTGPGMVNAATSTEVYHAPSTPGTYHITLRVFQQSSQTWAEFFEKRTTATITVTQ